MNSGGHKLSVALIELKDRDMARFKVGSRIMNWKILFTRNTYFFSLSSFVVAFP